MNIEKLVKLIDTRETDLDLGNSELILAITSLNDEEKIMLFVIAEVKGLLECMRLLLENEREVVEKVCLDVYVYEVSKKAREYSKFLKNCIISAGGNVSEYEALEESCHLSKASEKMLVIDAIALGQKSKEEELIDMANIIYTDYTIIKYWGETTLERITHNFKKKYTPIIVPEV